MNRNIVISVVINLILMITLFLIFKGIITKNENLSQERSIEEIVSPNEKWEKVAVGEGFIEGINFDENGQMWLVSPVTSSILKVEDGKAVPVGEPYGRPNGAKFYKDGRLFVTDQNGELYSVDTETGEREIIIDSFQGSPLRGLNDLVIDEYGGVYFTEPFGSDAINPDGRVFYLPPGHDSELQLFAENLAYPNGIAVSADGQIVYIAEMDKRRIIGIPSVHTDETPVTPYVFAQYEGGIGPDGLAVDSEGNLYVAALEAKKVVVFNRDGFKYGSIPLPEEAGKVVTNLALYEGYLYVTESLKNEVWRIKIKKS